MAGENIKVTYPHCVSVLKFVIAKLEIEEKEAKTEKDFNDLTLSVLYILISCLVVSDYCPYFRSLTLLRVTI